MCNNSMSTLRKVPTPLFLLGDGPVRLTGVRPPRVAGVLAYCVSRLHSLNHCFVWCSLVIRFSMNLVFTYLRCLSCVVTVLLLIAQ